MDAKRTFYLPHVTFLFFMLLILTSCGGGGDDDDWLFPLWVPTDIVVTDIDGDGGNDVLTISMLSKEMSQKEGYLLVYRQKSPGVFSAPDTYVVGLYPWKLVVGDVDVDGYPDLLVTDPDGRCVWLLIQDRLNRGVFLPPQQVASGIYTYEATIADLDGNGFPDIAIADAQKDSNKLVLLYQNPLIPGTFLPAVNFSLPGTSSNITSGDIDGDGLADLFMWIYTARSGYTPNGTLAIRLQQPGGILPPVTTLAPQTGLNVGLLSITDYDIDGKNDLFVYFTPFSSDYHAKLTVLIQGTQPDTFSSPVDTSLAGISGIEGAAVADLNGDSRPDVAVVGSLPGKSAESRVNLFLQAGGGSFALAGFHDVPIYATRMAAGDLDGDGLNDLVVLGGENQCLVMIQSHTAPGSFNAPSPLR